MSGNSGGSPFRGGVYKSKKPIYWCTSCQTALAEAEVEYEPHTSPSIFVRFPLSGRPVGDLPALKDKKVSVLIWTTTPWTIPANLALAFHPDYEYVAVEVRQEVFILAKGLLEKVSQRLAWSQPPDPGRAGSEISGREESPASPYMTGNRS